MKSVLISIRPEWCEKIASGEKTVEIRKTKPKLEPPFRCYIYCTIGDGAKGDILPNSGVTCGKVVGEFMCYRIYTIEEITKETIMIPEFQSILLQSCLNLYDLLCYLERDAGNQKGYGWHISDLVIYDHPKELSEFCSYDARICVGEDGFLMPTHAITRPPQSWCYVEEVQP